MLDEIDDVSEEEQLVDPYAREEIEERRSGAAPEAEVNV